MAGMLLLLGCSGPASAEGGYAGSDPQRREALLQQQAEALARLGGPQRRGYFQARRDLERRHSERRLAQLDQTERCLERARRTRAVQTCQRTLQDQRLQQRREEMADLSALQRRYGLPGWDGPRGWDRGGDGRLPYGDGTSPYGMEPYGHRPYGVQPYGNPQGGGTWLGDLLQSLLW